MNTLIATLFVCGIVGAIDAANPEVWVLGISLLSNLWQAFRTRNTKAALETVIDGIEHAARYDNNPKKAVKLSLASRSAKAVIDSVLVRKGYK